MIDGKPNYTRLSTIAMADVLLMNQDDRLKFINALCEMFENVMDPDYQPDDQSGFVGRAIQRQFAEFQLGTKKYMTSANRNPSGMGKQEKPGFETETHMGDPSGYPSGYNNGNPPGGPTWVFGQKPQQEQEQEIEREERENIDIVPGASSGGKPHTARFTPPTVEDVRQYCQERKNGIDPEYFVDYYQRSGWIMSNGQRMKDWKAAVRTWEQNQKGGRNGLSRANKPDRVPGQRDLYEC